MMTATPRARPPAETQEEAMPNRDSMTPDPPAGPHAFLQWKGTDACMDIYCSCGEQYHWDGLFAYRVRCGACGQAYALSPWIVLTPIADTDSGIPVLREGAD